MWFLLAIKNINISRIAIVLPHFIFAASCYHTRACCWAASSSWSSEASRRSQGTSWYQIAWATAWLRSSRDHRWSDWMALYFRLCLRNPIWLFAWKRCLQFEFWSSWEHLLAHVSSDDASYSVSSAHLSTQTSHPQSPCPVYFPYRWIYWQSCRGPYCISIASFSVSEGRSR